LLTTFYQGTKMESMGTFWCSASGWRWCSIPCPLACSWPSSWSSIRTLWRWWSRTGAQTSRHSGGHQIPIENSID